jgi:hypothetical protein
MYEGWKGWNNVVKDQSMEILMIILSHLYTHSLFTSFFSLNYMFQPNMVIIRFECKFEVTAQKLLLLFIFRIVSGVIII